jgi:hypothetical protein
VVAVFAVYRTDCHVADCRPAEGAIGALNPAWSFAPNHHANIRCLIALFLALSALRLDGGVEFPQLLPQKFRVGDDRGQSIVILPYHPLAPW